jgi:HK97 family phage prohead protease
MKISDGATDDMGEQVVQSGLDLTAYCNNPIVAWNHDLSQIVGKATAVWRAGDSLYADIEFLPAGVSHRADEVLAMFKNDFVKSASIGFDCTSSEPMDPAKPRGAQRYTSGILREISLCPLPANPRATVIDKSRAPVLSRSEMQRRARALQDVQPPAAAEHAPLSVQVARQAAAYSAAVQRAAANNPNTQESRRARARALAKGG